ncbi:amidohydrolase family protein [Bremerella alba]|uniref:Allantoinase n=1 Tax=Bremerella alba TaxID=980252 RepID=A0A7V9A5U0_9BACT|nr:amidohydrolase family protein [Bremerella alba]MBA2113552.1 Allantoinase [Bremerella alba]
MKYHFLSSTWLMVALCAFVWVKSVSTIHAEETATSLSEAIQKELTGIPSATDVGIWVGQKDGRTVFELHADQVMPTASSIKVAILIELFAEFESQLDSPLSGVAEILEDAKHPAFQHFTSDQREQVAAALGNATVAEIGWRMIHTENAPNRVYNGASNLAISLLGGPQALTDKIRTRHPQAKKIAVNRYMLADRNENGDNIATSRDLGVILSALASGDCPGIKPKTLKRIAGVLQSKSNKQLQAYRKGGSLRSYPLTKVESGWNEQGDQALVFVIMAAFPKSNSLDEPGLKYSELGDLTSQLQSLVERHLVSVDADIFLSNATLYLGDGNAPERGNVAIKDDKIVGVGAFLPGKIKMQVDCSGLAISPGFIDLHNHSDRPILRSTTRSAANYLTQGCTTIVTGNCGSGWVDVDEFYTKIDEKGAGVNVAHLLPQGALRSRVVGRENRKASSDELEEMRELAVKAMKEGAWGMSTGLIYVPSSYADTNELVAISQVISQYGGIYASHMRGEGTNLLESVDEILSIGRRASIPVHISHFKSSGKDSWGLVRIAIKNVQKALADGQLVTADQYPYAASSTSLKASLVPAWARSGSRDDRLKRMKADTAEGERIRASIRRNLELNDNGHRIQIASCSWHPEWAGRRLDEIAEEMQVSPFELALQILEKSGASVVKHNISEDDVRYIMSMPWVATASDGSARIPTASVPHPRSFGTFSRKLGRYAVAEKTIPLEQAVRSSTGLPADILGLDDRGYIRVGAVADLAVWKAEDFRDTATFLNPSRYSEGIHYVLVNGTFAIHEGRLTGALAGKALRHPSEETKSDHSR